MFNIQENISLADYTTFKVGGPAKYFLIVKTKKDLIEGINFSKKKKLPFFILGGGSNILVNDQGYYGLVLKMENKEYSIKDNIVISQSGAKLIDLVHASIENDLTGLEWAINLPGTIGGAVKINASCFNGEMKKIVKKTERVNNLIFSLELELKKGKQEESKKLIKEFIKKRNRTQPLEYPSAGCIFKNPKENPAGYLIDQAGLKGKRIGDAIISQKHANFILNLGKAKSKDILQLINLIKKKVKEKYRIELKEEIQYLGF